MLYESSVEGYSWTGTAVRDVAKGEELLISYMPNHSRKKDRSGKPGKTGVSLVTVPGAPAG